MTHTNDYPTEAYLALLETSAAVGLPIMFREDVTQHDRRRLCGADAPPRFGWVLRSAGTILLDARMSADARRGYRDDTFAGRGEGDQCYRWTGTQLVACSVEGMFAGMERDAAELVADSVGRGGY